MNSQTLITGASGMLGESLLKFFPEAEGLHGRAELNLASLSEVAKWLEGKKYRTIIHAAANTDLNTASDEFESIMNLHSNVVPLLADHCEHFIYISTVPVWEKESQLKKDYFISKRFGESETLRTTNGTVIRTNIFGKSNLVNWAYRSLNSQEKIRGFANSFFNPVHVSQLSDIIKDLSYVGVSSKKILTVASDTIVSKYDFLVQVAQKLSLRTDLITPHNKSAPEDLVLVTPDIILSLEKGINILRSEYDN